MVMVTAEVDIHASAKEILDVLADLGHYPQWSAVHKRARVESTDRAGRPQRAVMAVAAAGLTDEQTLDYQWADDGVEWSLVRAGQQRNQHGSYAITPGPGDCSHVRYELSIDPLVPLPGFLVRQVMKKAVSCATEGLRDRVESATH